MRAVTTKALTENPDCVAEVFTLHSGQSLVFRPLKTGDAALLAQYFLSLSPETRSRFAPHPFTKEQADKLCDEIDYERAIRLVALTCDTEHPEIVAYFILGLELRDAEQKRYAAHGTNLDAASSCRIAPSVSDSYQNHGLGSAIMERTLALVHRLGRTQVILQGGVLATNSRAVHFYEKFGFQRAGVFSTTVENIDMILDLAQTTRDRHLEPGVPCDA